jgi:hypothetical protein
MKNNRPFYEEDDLEAKGTIYFSNLINLKSTKKADREIKKDSMERAMKEELSNEENDCFNEDDQSHYP